MEEQVARYVARGQKQPLPPPTDETSFAGRVRKNLFATPLDGLLTIIFAILSVWVAWQILNWAVLTAVFQGENREACLSTDGQTVGACWAFVEARFSQFIYGLYPVAQRWRVDLFFAALVLILLPLAIPRLPFKTFNAVLAIFALPLFSFVILTGGRIGVSGGTAAFLFLVAAAVTLALASGRSATASSHPALRAATWLFLAAIAVWVVNLAVPSGTTRFLNLRFTTLGLVSFALSTLAMLAAFAAVLVTAERKSAALALLVPGVGTLVLIGSLTTSFGISFVPTNLWGGLLVTLVVAIVGIACSLPLGILLALGRQSRMPAVRLVCIVFIEFWRGVPLITVLFMANFMLPLFLPSGVTLNQLLRVLVGVSLFAAAYMAEVIRGGLQAIPRGQYEGADAMALTYWQKMRMIILPQALTLVIPGIVNTFIGLFKDTSLVYIIGLADLLGTVRRGFSDPIWITPSTPATGLVFAGFVFWLFCFGMSRYSIFMERNLSRGRKH